MNYNLFHRTVALVVFLISVTVLFFTVQPSVSFWDCGEFIAAGYYLQVPHPPGTPFFLILGRIFSMIPFADNIAFRINTISVLSSALSVMFLYLTVVKMIQNYKGRTPKDFMDALSTYVAAAIGALSFSFSDTFWFNGVEAEVYAMSTFLFAAIVWLMMVWNEKADEKDNEKYILMIAYLIGLSTAVHLMSVLAIISVVMVIMFKKYVDDDETLKLTGKILLGHIGVILLVAVLLWNGQKSSNPPTPEEYGAFDSRFKLIIAAISALIVGAFWKKLLKRNSIYLPLIFGGIALFVTYPGIVKMLPGFMANIAGNDLMIEIILIVALLAGLAYLINYSIKKNKPTLHVAAMSFLFIFLGFTTYAMVIIRANQDPPMNENEPNDFTELVSYLNREQYGDFPTFKRRFATEPHQMGVYSNYSSDLDFWWSYQMNHMMTRYWMWNYVGREGWNQDDGVNIWPLNSVFQGIGKIFNIRFAGEAKDSLYGIPFFLGLIGIYFHFRKDWKMASVFMVMFIFMGYLTAFYQNQQQPQPRERDYFYVGAFFVFSLWIGIAVKSLFDLALERIKSVSLSKATAYAILVLGIIFVPVRMLQANYFTHDRSRNWVPWDYSYNLLQSCAPNAILFTNGDNDTFPLWYLQDVEGVRRDIRVVNLSLLNTNWYIHQLKNLEPYGAKKVAMRLTDSQIDQIRPIQWEARDFTITVPPDFYKKSSSYSEIFGNDSSNYFDEYYIKDSSIIKQGTLTWRMNHTVTYGNIKAVRVQDLMVKEIVESFKWERPIYFAVTCTEDSKIGLSDYLKMEGMAMRLVPEKKSPGREFVNEPILRKQIYHNYADDDFSREYRPGMKFRGMNDSTIFFDENHTRLVQNYRNAFIRLSLYYSNDLRNNELALDALNTMEQKLPRKLLPMDYRLLFDIGNLYLMAGDNKTYSEIVKDVEVEALRQIELNPRDVSSPYNPYRLLIEIYENQQEYQKAIGLMEGLLLYYPNDPTIQAQIQKYKMMQSPPDTTKK